MNPTEIISLIANIVFVTWGVAQLVFGKRAERDKANYLNAAYEMAKRLAQSLGGEHARRGQAEDIASLLKSATLSSMDRERNEIDREDEGADTIKQKKAKTEA